MILKNSVKSKFAYLIVYKAQVIKQPDRIGSYLHQVFFFIVPYHIIMNALAYQADPSSVEPLKNPASNPATKEVNNT